MQEACFCGRTGEIEDREPVLNGEERRALQCSECGHVDDLRWLSDEAGSLIWEEVKRRRETSAEKSRPAA